MTEMDQKLLSEKEARLTSDGPQSTETQDFNQQKDKLELSYW